MSVRLWLFFRAAFMLVLAPWLPSSHPARTDAPRPTVDRAFLERHWRVPIPPQGAAPATWSPLERSLAPDACGTCHPAQFNDWKGSIHSRSMGPGISGQLVEMSGTDPDAARSCPTCHAPLAEQGAEVDGPGGRATNPAFDAALRARGVVCASCHVRGHQRFGPPRRDGSITPSAAGTPLPHGGVTRNASFLASEFCASCHQFAPDGFRVNGKLVQNTFEEWKASPAAQQGLQCQDCHMPDRRHLWRGIHDPEMVSSGVQIDFTVAPREARDADEIRATLSVHSVRVGHFFPTYVTPRVVMRMELLDAGGRAVAGSAQERVIARSVTLDLSRELEDTRIPPGGRVELEYRRRVEGPDLRLRALVAVFPDHFYSGFFEALLASGAGGGEDRIRAALAETRRSPFVIFEREVSLPRRSNGDDGSP
jgi:hypothetical protein